MRENSHGFYKLVFPHDLASFSGFPLTKLKPGMSHEHAKIEYVIDYVRILLDDIRECLGIYECDRKLLVECIVIPIHFGKPHDAAARVVPTARSRETPNEHRRWRRFEGSLLVDRKRRAFQINPANAPLRPEQRFVAVDRKT